MTFSLIFSDYIYFFSFQSIFINWSHGHTQLQEGLGKANFLANHGICKNSASVEERAKR